MTDAGLTHVALLTSNPDASIAFDAKYASMRVSTDASTPNRAPLSSGLPMAPVRL